jgi:hypothetical protein
MDVSLSLQYALIALAVIASAWVVLDRQLPAGARRLRVAMALWLLREGRAQALRRIGRRIAPPPLAGTAACGGCNGCATGSAKG